MLAAPVAHAQVWRTTPTILVESTLTDNVDLQPSDRKRSDWVNQIAPGVQFTGTSAHGHIVGDIEVPLLFYTRTPANNYVAPRATINGTLEAIEKFFFIDASVNVSQPFQTPFGATPNNLVNATNNRYTAQDYSVSPYIRGKTGGEFEYELRNTSTWSVTNAQGPTSGNGYTNDLVGRIGRNVATGLTGWALDYQRTESDFSNRGGTETTEIARAHAFYGPDPAWRFSLIGGYEDNKFVFTENRGPVYGAGVSWHPNQRTNLDATLEHRFFGPGYRVKFNHRLPLSVFTLEAFRDTTTFPEQLASLPAGANVNQLLNTIFTTRVPDPLERQGIVDAIIRERNLPSQLTSPVILSNDRFTLVESLTATYGILGARNSLFFTVYRTRDRPVQGFDDSFPDELLTGLNLDTTQVGGNVAFTHQLMPTVILSANVDFRRSTANDSSGAVTRDVGVRGQVSTALTVLTNVFAGVRFQESRSDVIRDYQEFAVFVGMFHRFH